MQSANLRPVWIASYPRSGNTFLRIILETVFRLPTYSVHRVEGQEGFDPSAEALASAPFLPANWRQLLSEAPTAKLTLIKTHGAPEPQGRAIYVVRDGRAAIDSFFHYHQSFVAEKVTLTEVIAGACYYGSWSSHYQAWQPRIRPNTLFLRYEDLVARPEELLPQLASFLQVEPSGGRIPTFAELKERYPAFFRRGKNEDFLQAWTPGQMALFNHLHGPVMQELGYSLAATSESVNQTVLELAQSAVRLHRQYLEQWDLVAGLNRALSNEVQAVRKLSRKEEMLNALLHNPCVKTGIALGLIRPQKLLNDPHCITPQNIPETA